ncbi:MAG TPA: RHS repeat-associated core domain-containing protein [Polyangiaceae bacterium]|nr:RHS repeat-associated core domain-containing protein [Polyangiaceae bacterium]
MVATFDEQERILAHGSETFQQTATGDVLQKTDGTRSLELTYDELGNLATANVANGKKSTTIDYVVDGTGRQIARKLNGRFDRALLYQDQLRPIAQIDAAGTFSHFVYTSGESAPDAILQDGVPYRVLKDHLGSVRLVVNAKTGVVAQKLEYDEFGVVLSDSNPGFQPFGFAGGLYDALTGLVRFGARDYDAETGRWAAKDPIGFAGGVNMYAYCGNDPVNQVDPTGLDPEDYNPVYMVFGTAVHNAIGERYAEQHEGQRVFVNKALSTIARWFGKDASVLLRWLIRPDIFNSTTGDLYETKAIASRSRGKAQAMAYVAALNQLKIGAHLGPTDAAGTSGTVQVWGYAVEYYSPEPGVIVYERGWTGGSPSPQNVVVGVGAAAAAAAVLVKLAPLLAL